PHVSLPHVSLPHSRHCPRAARPSLHVGCGAGKGCGKVWILGPRPCQVDAIAVTRRSTVTCSSAWSSSAIAFCDSMVADDTMQGMPSLSMALQFRPVFLA